MNFDLKNQRSTNGGMLFNGSQMQHSPVTSNQVKNLSVKLNDFQLK